MPEPPDTIDQSDPRFRSHLFTVRMWLEQLGKDRTEWRGKVRHVMSGQTRYFRDWPALIAFIEKMLPDPNASERDHPSTIDRDRTQDMQ